MATAPTMDFDPLRPPRWVDTETTRSPARRLLDSLGWTYLTMCAVVLWQMPRELAITVCFAFAALPCWGLVLCMCRAKDAQGMAVSLVAVIPAVWLSIAAYGFYGSSLSWPDPVPPSAPPSCLSSPKS